MHNKQGGVGAVAGVRQASAFYPVGTRGDYLGVLPSSALFE